MEEELTCPVCLELFADPLMLPCSHSICKACLQDIMNSRAKASKEGLECPACRQKHHLPTEEVLKLPKNLALENIVFRYQELRCDSLSKTGRFGSSEVSPEVPAVPVLCENITLDESGIKFNCGLCEESKVCQADWFCEQCQVFYCQACLNVYHPKRGSLFKHKIRKPTLRESVECMLHCGDHHTEPATIFCDTCKVVACHLCVCQGLGSHCHHLILDLETARQQLKESLQKAKQELSNLTSSFSDRNIMIASHMQDIQDFEASAKSIISSQYNCILSDIAATLNLLKQKSLDCISSFTQQHYASLTAQQDQIKTVLLECQSLETVCDSFIMQHSPAASAHISPHKTEHTMDSGKNVSHESYIQRPTKAAVGTAEKLISLTNKDSCKLLPRHPRLSSLPILAKVGDEKNQEKLCGLESEYQNETHKVFKLKSRSCSESGSRRVSSELSIPADHDQLSFVKGAGLRENIKDNNAGDMTCSTNASGTNKRSVVAKNVNGQHLSACSPGKQALETSTNYPKKIDKRRADSVSFDNGDDVIDSLETGGENSAEKVHSNNLLLLRASQAEPLLKQVTSLIEQNSSQELVGAESMSPLAIDEENILSCVPDFHTSCLLLLNNITGQFHSDCSVIIPAVRSVVTPTNLSGSSLRVQSRTLTTWGFNSTTFTADPLEKQAQWTVSVSKNTNHIGDIKSGYLFGFGVSTKPLGSKEQAGLTADSHAIACIGGQLVMCQDSVQNVILTLTDLPVNASIAIFAHKCGLVLAYRIQMNGNSHPVCGRRVITLSRDGQEEVEPFSSKLYPVFTVSQRVKLQFPVPNQV